MAGDWHILPAFLYVILYYYIDKYIIFIIFIYMYYINSIKPIEEKKKLTKPYTFNLYTGICIIKSKSDMKN